MVRKYFKSKPPARLVCARCTRNLPGLSFPLWPKFRLCYACVKREREDRAQGQTNIYDENAREYDGTNANSEVLERY